jgi:hypothetical protein
MRIRITESQYRTLVNKPRDVVFGNVNEDRTPKETPEEIDTKIEEILNYVRNGGKFVRSNNDPYYRWLIKKLKSDKTEEQKFKKVFNQITEIQEELDNKKIKEILNHVRNGGEFTRNTVKDDNFKWLKNKSLIVKNGKFQNALDEIKKIQEDLENKKIEEILNHVRNGGSIMTDYHWLRNKIRRDKTEEQKFKKVFNQITEIQEELDNKKIKEILNHVRNGGEFTRDSKDKNYTWLQSRLKNKTKEKKIKKAFDQISEIQAKLGIKRESWGERIIKETLIGMGFEDIPRQGQHIYKDCRNSLTCKFYKFDIYLPYNENNYMVGKNEGFYIPETGIIFEYDGIQHFQSTEYFGGEEGFKQRIHSDREKNSYCKNNKQNDKPNPIKLVRIPYTSKTRTDIQNDIELALKDPSTFILTGDYPQLGWNQQ